MKICLWFAWAWPVFPFLTFQVSCHGFVSCRRHGWCDNATAQGTDNKWTVPGFGPPWHCSQACSSILFFCFNALRCLNSICQFVMFDATNSLNVVIYLSKKKKKTIIDVVISITKRVRSRVQDPLYAYIIYQEKIRILI